MSTMKAAGEMPTAELLALAEAALADLERFAGAARTAVANEVLRGDRVDARALETHQFAAHGYAWLATYVEALTQMLRWARGLQGTGGLRELETLLLQAAFGEYLAQVRGGLPLSQGELTRPADLGVSAEALQHSAAVQALVTRGNTAAVRGRIAELLAPGDFGADGLADPTLELVRDQFHRFASERVAPHAQSWHRENRLIPVEVIQALAELGVFGLTVPERWGGLGMGRLAMCLVAQELSRASLAVGSLGTRSEIAAELVRLGGTAAQQRRWLPGIASGAVLPTAVFTEPDVGSDLAHLRTRAVRDGPRYRITGTKTWSTHAARADLMTLLARTGRPEEGHRGLSMFLVEKPRGDERRPFPTAHLTGSEIPVLGYRGMKEYTLFFDDFPVPAESLLGEVEGEGFRHLMRTFESARIQTAARAAGVAQSALDLSLDYARARKQFGKPIVAFPRIAGKIAWMAVETMIAKQLTFFAAREKDGGQRSDIQAGMAKLLAARVAWTNADNAVQVHGGSGYAEEYPISRILVDARILNIFEGTAEIQAQVIARGLLERPR
jgi:(2S)-methylsuccinyl-CoA dehydrogenase